MFSPAMPCLLNGLFTLNFLAKILYEFLIPPMCAMCSVHLILLLSTNLIIFVKLEIINLKSDKPGTQSLRLKELTFMRMWVLIPLQVGMCLVVFISLKFMVSSVSICLEIKQNTVMMMVMRLLMTMTTTMINPFICLVIIYSSLNVWNIFRHS